MKQWHVSQKEEGQKLVAFLSSKNSGLLSSRKIKKAIENNCCRINGQTVRKASETVNKGSLIEFDDQAVNHLPPAHYELETSRIIYEDNSLFIYNKPPGLSSDSSGLASLLPQYLPLHRLDRETSGVIAFAKTKKACDIVTSFFKDRQVEKEYIALVDKIPELTHGQIESFIGKHYQKGSFVLWGNVSKDRGRLAKTNWTLHSRGENCSVIICRPITGRTHQLRIHLKQIGHPILGDFRYTPSYSCTYPAKRCLLHASSLSFNHPITEKYMNFTAPIPFDLEEAIKMTQQVVL